MALLREFQVDWDGDGAWNPAVDGIVVVDAGAAPGLALGATFADVTIQPTDAVFTVVGGGAFPGGPTKCGLFSHLGSTRLALSALPAGAKFFGGATGDGGMPKSQPMPAVLFVLGDSSNLAARQVTIASATLGGATYAFAP